MSTALPQCDRAIAEAVPQAVLQEGVPPSPQTSLKAPSKERVLAPDQPKHPRLIVATTVLASSLAFIDGSVVNVGLPAIAESFGSATISLSWVVSGYLLPLSALLLTGGAAGDRFGHRPMLMAGVGLFLMSSLLCALAPSLTWLLCGRALQGAGAAMLMPTSLAILGRSFSGQARGRAIGTWAAAGAAAGALGPLVGGWLVDAVGWRAIFLVNVPIAAGALYFSSRYLENAPNTDAPPLDVLGAALATIGLAALTLGLTLGSGPRGASVPAIAGVVAGVAFLALLIAVEHRRGAAAMMPLTLFSSRSFVGLSLVTFLLYGALGGLLVLLPYVLIELEHYSATQAGAALLPMPLVIALTAPTMGRLAAKSGPRLPLSLGPALVAVGFLMAMRIAGDASYWTTVLPAMLVLSLGMAGAVAPLTTAVLASVGPDHSGVASGLNSALARTGGLVATALVSAALMSHASALADAFRWAMAAGALAAAAAGACAFVWLRPGATDES